MNTDILERYGIDLDVFDVGDTCYVYIDEDGDTVHATSDCAAVDMDNTYYENVRTMLPDVCGDCWIEFFDSAHPQWSLFEDLHTLLGVEEDIKRANAPESDPGSRLKLLQDALGNAQSVKGVTGETVTWREDLKVGLADLIATTGDLLASKAWKDAIVAYHAQKETREWERFLGEHGHQGTVDDIQWILEASAKMGAPRALAQLLENTQTRWLPEKPYRTQGKESFPDYVADVRGHALLHEATILHADLEARLTSSDLQEVVVVITIPRNLRTTVRPYQSVFPYAKASFEERYLVVAPTVVVNGLRDVHYPYTDRSIVGSLEIPLPDPVTLETMVSLWDPADPLFKDLNNLVEAARITR